MGHSDHLEFISAASVTAVILALFLAAPRGVAAPPNQPIDPPAVRALAHQGMKMLMNGDVDGAVSIFKQVNEDDSASPLGNVLEADAIWWKIYYSTANLVDPDVFDVVTSYHTAEDGQFESLVQAAIQKAKTNIQSGRLSRQAEARNYLYEGMAYALEARLAGLRARDLPTARAGKKMRALLLTALQLDPSLTDAYAGIGLYNYFVDTLPTIVKMLRFLVGLPGGNRALGLEQMQKAATSGDFTRAEAKFYLAKDYTRRNEMQFAKALELFQQLDAEFPANPFWKMMIASCQMRLKRRQQGEAAYRAVLKESARENTVAAAAVHKQVEQALERLHLGAKSQ